VCEAARADCELTCGPARHLDGADEGEYCERDAAATGEICARKDELWLDIRIGTT
jgi:hypothetical protein